ncbi:glycosyl hydrolase family 8 [Clostridium uliginosum]|uniref:Glycosyl hydrolases family 8 n=1 Tax=Clostridium uliginosum TaxID=119641 RepID=A0A1I1S0S6_9CLOT|nr:glycosyl hydrolase family 8 [Clostridium uliginosum]SFD38148.1 Glycosyl hydrolases family 8 [Clostridium uliginosum]
MKKKYILITGMILLLIAVAYYVLAPYFRSIYSEKIWLEAGISQEEHLLSDFINNNLIDKEGGIYTNYIDTNSDGDITKGHTVLSESEGIMLLYALEKNDRVSFDKTLDYIKNYMMLSNNLISWRIESGTKLKTSATIDDLRIVKALLLADEKWGNKSYRVVALRISKGIYKDLVDGTTLIDFNDGKEMSKTTTLCYLDIKTLKMLSNLNSSWEKVLNKSSEIIENAYISNDMPLYKKEFNRSEGTYDNNDNIDTLLSMIVLLNKQECGQDVSRSLEWIKDRLKKEGFIVTSYSEVGKATSNIESTSIYSMIVRMATNADDEELSRLAMEKVNAFQVKNQNSKIYGGYGQEDGNNVYSFDNLNALLAHRYFKY